MPVQFARRFNALHPSANNIEVSFFTGRQKKQNGPTFGLSLRSKDLGQSPHDFVRLTAALRPGGAVAPHNGYDDFDIADILDL